MRRRPKRWRTLRQGDSRPSSYTKEAHEGSTISPWVLALFLPLLLAVGAVLFPVLQAAMTTTTLLTGVATRLVSKKNGHYVQHFNIRRTQHKADCHQWKIVH